jgi:hypothetical protein
MIYYKTGSEITDLSSENLKEGLFEALDKLGQRR